MGPERSTGTTSGTSIQPKVFPGNKGGLKRVLAQNMMLQRFSKSAYTALRGVSQKRGIQSLQEVLSAQVPLKQAEMKELRQEYGAKVLGEVTVDQCIGGGRGVKSLYYETSLLDADEGIRFRGLSIPECQDQLPSFHGPPDQGEPLPEALIWLLLTSEVPTVEQTQSLTDEFRSRRQLPPHIEPMIRAFPKGRPSLPPPPLPLVRFFLPPSWSEWIVR